MSVADNLRFIREQAARAAQAAGRDPADIRLIAVSKQQPSEAVDAALDAGQLLFGENRVQEARQRWAHRRAALPGLELHLIGPLQTNKAGEAVALFDVIQTLDREKLARALGREMDRQGRALPCFIQINTGAEPQKAGIAPEDLPGFLDFCRSVCGLNITGLMCIPPAADPPAAHFVLLARLAAAQDLPHLSMGMSGDYEIAAALGASHIRVGTGVFGVRG